MISELSAKVMKNFTEFVECGGKRKFAAKGTEVKDCNTYITDN